MTCQADHGKQQVPRTSRTARRWMRREFLRLGTLGGIGLGLPSLIRARSSRASSSSAAFGRAERCILVFLNGGPSQLDLWDMKPEAPVEVRGELKPISTNTPGIQISELLPLLARQVHRFKIVRSVTHPCSVHTTGVYTMLTGTVHSTPIVDQLQALPSDHPHLGSVVAKFRGANRGLPAFVTLPRLFEAPPVDGIWPGQNAGFLGRRFDPFVAHGNKQTAEFSTPALELPREIDVSRLEDRHRLLGQLNGYTQARRVGAAAFDDLATFYEQSFSMLSSPQVRSAFNLHAESDAMRDRYGRHLFGQGVLLARRLIEAGVRLATVYWIDPEPPGPGGGEYDSHGRIYHHMRERLVPPTDRALAALFADLDERGLLDSTLVIVMGEFGRTPRLNPDAGRDHWPHVQSILLAGAGITGGSVYGASTPTAAEPNEHPVAPQDLAQAIFHLLGVPSDAELHDAQGRPIPASRGAVLPGLIA